MPNAREEARRLVKESLPPADWERNTAIVGKLRNAVKTHRLFSHPALVAAKESKLDAKLLIAGHLEFRHGFSGPFGDALLHAMLATSKVEQRLGQTARFASRFLIAYNLLDELGFLPASESGGDYGGSALRGHYLQLGAALRDLGVDDSLMRNYPGSDAANACRRALEDTYGDALATIAVLSASETAFAVFAGPWAKATSEKTSLRTDVGYHAIHAPDGDTTLEDGHAQDLWMVLTMAIQPEDADRVGAALRKYLDTCAAYLDFQMSHTG